MNKPIRIQRKRTKTALKTNKKQQRREYVKKWLKSESRPKAKCHLDRPHRARGMCNACYDKWLYKNSEKYKNQRLKSAKNWALKNPTKKKYCDNSARLLRRYGITVNEFEDMKFKQNNSCLICGKKTALAIDHCHETGKVRGLLCFPCNGTLGILERIIRNDRWIIKAKNYLGGNSAS